MTFALSKRSLIKLQGVHQDLVAIVSEAIAISPVDFRVGEGLRTLERQRELFAAGKSQTMKSRHLTGHAVDLVAIYHGEVSWDMELYKEINKAMFEAVEDLNSLKRGVTDEDADEKPRGELGQLYSLEWGGNWTTFKDGPHWQLPWAKYPA